MRTTHDILKEMKSAQADHHERSPNASTAEMRPLSDRIKALRVELSDAISEGATPCPDCGNPPIGVMHDARMGGHEYEVGCVVCKDHRGERSKSRAGAVAAWNDGPSSWVPPKS